MRLFADKELAKSIEIIDFGKVEEGDEKEITVYLFNDSKAVLTNLEYSFEKVPISETVLILKPEPITIQPKEALPLTIVWKPSMKFKQALQIEINIKGDKVYLARRTVRREREV